MLKVDSRVHHQEGDAHDSWWMGTTEEGPRAGLRLGRGRWIVGVRLIVDDDEPTGQYESGEHGPGHDRAGDDRAERRRSLVLSDSGPAGDVPSDANAAWHRSPPGFRDGGGGNEVS
jgi:hypothetical protein